MTNAALQRVKLTDIRMKEDIQGLQEARWSLNSATTYAGSLGLALA